MLREIAMTNRPRKTKSKEYLPTLKKLYFEKKLTQMSS